MKILLTKEEKSVLEEISKTYDFPINQISRKQPEHGASLEFDIKPDLIVKNIEELVKWSSASGAKSKLKSIAMKWASCSKKEKGKMLLIFMAKKFPKGFIN